MKRKFISAIVYGTSSVCFFFYLDWYFGAAPIAIGPLFFGNAFFPDITIAAVLLFAAACVMCFFKPYWATVCALSAQVLLVPFLVSQSWSDLALYFAYRSEMAMATTSLIVSAVYSILQFRSQRQPDYFAEPGRMGNLKLVASIFYAVSAVVASNWRPVSDWLFRLRYGS